MPEKISIKNKKWYKTWWGILILLCLLPFTLSYWIWKRNWNLKVRSGSIIGVWLLVIVGNGLLSLSYSNRAVKKPLTSINQKLDTALSVQPNSGKELNNFSPVASIVISPYPIKKMENYTIVNITKEVDKNNKPFDNIYAFVNDSSQISDLKLTNFSREIKNSECNGSCLISWHSDIQSVQLGLELDQLTNDNDRTQWRKQHPDFFNSILGFYDSDTDVFDSLLELSPEPSVREVIKGSTSKGEEFYNKVETLYKQGLINGKLYSEYESDAVVDVNLDGPSVQLGLKYNTIIDKIDEQNKALILKDFYTIKNMALQDKSLILEDYGTPRVIVLTFHDVNGIARGDLQQLMIESEPSWSMLN